MRKPGRSRPTRKSDEARTLRGGGLPLNQRFILIYLITIAALTLGFSVFIFRNMTGEVIAENESYQRFRKNETAERLETNINSINMSARLFQNDDTLVSVLNVAAQDRFLSTGQLISFHDNDVTTLDGMVHNNPAMYATRVYGANDNVQEMMSIIFKNSRLKNLSWGQTAPITGWHFNYYDTAFSDTGGNQNTRLVSNVEAITDATLGTVGYVEAAMTMEQMFPEMYGTDDESFAFFMDQKKNLYLGTAAPEGASDLAQAIIADKSNYSEEKIFEQEFSGHTYVVYSIRQNEMDIRYFGVRDITKNLAHVRYLRIVYILLSLAIFILMGIVANSFISRMLGQLYEMVRTMQSIEGGDLSVRNRILRRDETGHLALRMNQMLDRINELMEENINRERLVR
ncbi:MAG: HAMP domain-containing protein, partial [Lachnospiraceae bacterium]|nr:HAMP domain-containing protein [Lachnospiraceae bacterium]